MSFDPNNQQQLTEKQIEDAHKFISQFKVGELAKILDKFNDRRRGLKQDLVNRVHKLVRDPSTQKEAIQIINFDMRRQTTTSSFNAQNRGFGATNPFAHSQNTFGRIGLPQNGNGGSTMYGAQSMMQHASRPASSQLKIVPLPFFDVKKVLIPPTEMPAATSPTHRNPSKMTLSFSIDPDVLRTISYDLNSKTLPRYEIQLRFFNCTDLKEPQKDEFPLNINLRVNNNIISLPSVIPTNKPNAEAKRPSRPVCITAQCQKRAGPQQLSLEWGGDKRSWAVVVYYVERVNTDILHRRMIENNTKHREIRMTREEIISRLNGNDDDGIAMDQLKIGLLCPLIKVRMTCPARCVDCTHLQCFDLKSYLMMNEKRPVWNCPVCSGYAPYEKLIIDEYFKDVLEKVGADTTEVELKPDGSFDVLKTEDAYEISSDDDDNKVCVKKEVKPGNSGSNGNGSTSTAKPSSKIDDDDVIVLSDSDDEDQDVARAISNSLKGNESSNTTTPEPEASSSGGKKRKAIEIITLDDTPPRPSEKRRIENLPAPVGNNNNSGSTSQAANIQRNDSTSSNMSVSGIPLPCGTPTTSKPATLVEALENVNNSDKQPYHNQHDIFTPNNMHQNQVDYSYPSTTYPISSWRLPTVSSISTGPPMHNYAVPPPTPITPANQLIGRQMNDVMGGGGGPSGPIPTFNFSQPNYNQLQQQNMMRPDMPPAPQFSNMWEGYVNALSATYMQQQQPQQQQHPQGQFQPNNHQQQNPYRK